MPKIPLTKIVEAARETWDAWASTTTGLGTERDKRMSFAFDPSKELDDITLESLYECDAMAARIVEIVPDEAFRAGYTIKVDDDEEKGTAIQRSMATLHFDDLAKEAVIWGQLFGGGALWVIVDDGRDPKEPLDMAGIKSILGFRAYDRQDLQVAQRYGRGDTPETVLKQGSPEVYRIASTDGIDGATVHETRLIRFYGVTPTRRRRAFYQDWGVSILQRVWDTLRDYSTSYGNVAHSMQNLSQGVWKLKGLRTALAATPNLVRARMERTDRMRSSVRGILLDTDGEDFQHISNQLSGVEGVLTKLDVWLAGAVGLPLTVLMWQSPGGLNGGGESDLQVFHKRVGKFQETNIKPAIIRVATIFLAAEGIFDADVDVVFAPLAVPSEKELAETREIQARADKTYTDAGVLLAEEVALSRFGAGGYSLETKIDIDNRNDLLDAEYARTTDAPSVQLNGAQITALVDVVEKISAGTITEEAGIGVLAVALAITEEQARAIIADSDEIVSKAVTSGNSNGTQSTPGQSPFGQPKEIAGQAPKAPSDTGTEGG